MKIYIINRGEVQLRYVKLYFHGESNVECVAAEFDEFLRSNPVQCIVSPANTFGLMNGGYDLAITHYFWRSAAKTGSAAYCRPLLWGTACGNKLYD